VKREGNGERRNGREEERRRRMRGKVGKERREARLHI